jgi:ribosomal protein L22
MTDEPDKKDLEDVDAASAADSASDDAESAAAESAADDTRSDAETAADTAADSEVAEPVAEADSEDEAADDAGDEAEESEVAADSEDAEAVEADASDDAEDDEDEEDEDDEEPAAEAPAAPAKPARSRRRGSVERDPDLPPPVVRAQAKYVRSSARKARLVCDQFRGKSVEDARAILAVTPRAIARDWSKLLESAVANAEHNHELVGEDLVVKAVTADEGPTIKRFQPRAKGRATRIRKRTSHLTIQLTPKD